MANKLLTANEMLFSILVSSSIVKEGAYGLAVRLL